MSISCNYIRTLKVVVAGVTILTSGTFFAKGQENNLSRMVEASGEIDEMENATTAYNSGHLDEALRHFQKMAQMDPNSIVAKMGIADSLARKVVPGVDTPENLKIAQMAINAYQEALAMPLLTLPGQPMGHHRNLKAEKQIARINFNINKLDESKAWQKKVLAEEPKDAEAAFAVGLIDGMEAQQTAQAALAQAGLKDDYEGNAKAPASVMKLIKAQNGALVKEALLYLNQAVENRPDYDNAMTFLGLAYRRKADLDWGNEAARKDDVAKADEWIRKAKETHKANEEKTRAAAESAKP
jgi:tetratricopeptide (TPR) repeat protein